VAPSFHDWHYEKPLRRFIELLREAEVDVVIDTRRNNTSQLAGFSKKDDLAFLLIEGFQIHYEHRPELAPSELLLAAFLKSGIGTGTAWGFWMRWRPAR